MARLASEGVLVADHQGGILAALGDRVVAADPSLLDVEKAEIRHLPRLELHREQGGRRRTFVVRGGGGECARAVSDIRKSAQDDLNAQRWGMAVAAVGFDTETRPKFTKGGSAHKVALVQIATYEHAWLFRCCKIGIPNALQELLEDPQILKVGVGVRSDVSAIRTRLPSFNDHGSFCDLSDGFKMAFPRLRRLGLRNLSASILGMSMSKAQQTSNWEAGSLTRGQQIYAANDAYVGLELLGILTGVRKVAPYENPCSDRSSLNGTSTADRRDGRASNSAASQTVKRVDLSVAICCSQESLDAAFGEGHGWTPCGVESTPWVIFSTLSKNLSLATADKEADGCLRSQQRGPANSNRA